MSDLGSLGASWAFSFQPVLPPVINSNQSVVAFSANMNGKSVFVALVLLCVAAAQRQPAPRGMIHGIVIGQDGMPSTAIRLVAEPLGVGLPRAVLPHTTTNDTGEYRFENLPWWGRYTVYADDEKAGYSEISTGPAGDSHPPEVEITPEKPKAELNITLSPKAGFVQIHLKNRNTGAAISTMAIRVVSMENPESFLFTMGCDSGRVILVPPDKNLLLHVKSVVVQFEIHRAMNPFAPVGNLGHGKT